MSSLTPIHLSQIAGRYATTFHDLYISSLAVRRTVNETLGNDDTLCDDERRGSTVWSPSPSATDRPGFVSTKPPGASSDSVEFAVGLS